MVKSLTGGAAIIRLLEPPGRIAGGEIILDHLMRTVRGRKIGAIFLDSLTI